MNDMFRYESITKDDWKNPNITDEQRSLMIEYIVYADKNDIELTMDQLDFKFTLLTPEMVEEIGENYGMSINKPEMEWIITASVTGDNGYDIFKATEELESIWWRRSKASKNIHIGDIVYMYVGKPYSKIMYKFLCVDENENLSLEEGNEDNKYWNNPKSHPGEKTDYFKIKRLQFLDDDDLHLKTLQKLNLVKGNIQGSYRLDKNHELFDYLHEKFNKTNNNDYYFENEVEYEEAVNSSGLALFIEDSPQKKIDVKYVNGIKKYKRNPQLGRLAIEKAEYKCEIDSIHKTFISRESYKPYLEAHHLVPISAQDDFEYSLDVPANIVALCSTCHNEIHYGKEAKKLISKLYNDRKERLNKSGITISIDELLSLYSL